MMNNSSKNTKPNHGKQPHQKIKPYVVLQYLLRYTDENNVATGDGIKNYLKDDCGIYAERRSIYRDIEEINKVALMLEEECTIDEAEEMLESGEYEDSKLIAYNKNKKGFYVQNRQFELDDIRLIAESVYAARFITKSQSQRIVRGLREFVSEYQAEQIEHDAFLVDRVKTNNTRVLNNISAINMAMSKYVNGKLHHPEQVRFKYLKYSVGDMTKPKETKREHVVSPYALLINDGYYYLLAYDSKSEMMKTFRVDRMAEVILTGDAREGEDVFRNIELKDYTQRVFSMFGGTPERITLRFINKLTDTMVDRFGRGDYNATYSVEDANHSTVSVNVEISNQFFGWVLGFGREVKLIAPDSAVDKFKEYVDKIRDMY